MSFDFDSPDYYTTFIIEHGGPVLQKMLSGQTNERRKEIFKAINKAQKSTLTILQERSDSKMKLYLLLVENE